MSWQRRPRQLKSLRMHLQAPVNPSATTRRTARSLVSGASWRTDGFMPATLDSVGRPLRSVGPEVAFGHVDCGARDRHVRSMCRGHRQLRRTHPDRLPLQTRWRYRDHSPSGPTLDGARTRSTPRASRGPTSHHRLWRLLANSEKHGSSGTLDELSRRTCLALPGLGP